MRIRTLLLASLCLAAPASAGPVDDILAANRAATGGDAWNGKAALKLTWHYEGQGLKGTTDSVYELKSGRFVDSYDLGAAVGAQGFDGSVAWQKDPSGAITLQTGGSALPLAYNEAYRDANLWWRADKGGAEIALDAKKSDANADALSVTPKNGENFTAWFDKKTHLLVRTFEQQDSSPTTSIFSDYRKVDGVMFAGKTLQTTGNAKYDQVQTLTGSSFLPVQADSVFAPPKSDIADATIAGGTETTFPFRLINNHIYAEVKVNGKGPYVFIFDTGGLNIVTLQLARELGLPVEGHMEARGAGSGTMEAGFTKVKSLELGNASLKDQHFGAFPLDNLSDVEGFDEHGMIGFETFRRFVTRIDYGAHTITLIDRNHFDAKDAGTAVPIAFDGNVPEVQGTFAGIKGNFQLDTGARSSLTLTAPFVEKNGLRAHAGKGVDAVTGWGVGGPTRAYAVRGGPLVFGGQTINGAVVELASDKGGAMAVATLAGNIGAGILKRFVLTLDYEHNVLYLKPVAGPVADLDTFDRAGMWLNRDAKGFKIVDITRGSPAEHAGLKAGDLVVAVDGKDTAGTALYDLRVRLRNDAAGTKVSFTVERAGVKAVHVVVLRDLI